MNTALQVDLFGQANASRIGRAIYSSTSLALLGLVPCLGFTSRGEYSVVVVNSRAADGDSSSAHVAPSDEPSQGALRQARALEYRLRALLDANNTVIGDLSLSVVLRRIVEAACELTNAPFGALGVIAPEGHGLEEFVHVGMDPETVELIGHLPEGKGLLGALIEDPRAIRLRDMRADPRSVGFPEGHPPMRGFLGLPVRVGQEIFGNLYLASLSEANFAAQDEELVAALAATAGIAIANARMYEESKRRQDWLHASTDVTRQLLSAHGVDALELIGARVGQLAHADIVTVVLPDAATGELSVAAAAGRDAHRFRGYSYPLQGTLSERVLKSGRPAVMDDASGPEASQYGVVRLTDLLPIGPVMGLPLAGAKGIRGVLIVGRLHGHRPFTAADLDMATTFAYHASVALELADGRREAQRLEMLEDRARIARDLHDHVIQQLFASGMNLQGALGAIEDSPARDRIEGVVDDIDQAIRQIRASIFQLRPHTLSQQSIHGRVVAVVAEVRDTLGLNPHVEFSGPVDSLGEQDLGGDLTAVVREALTNAAKHADAHTVRLQVAIDGTELQITVRDDGVGMRDTARRSGLANLRERAHARSGSFTINSGIGGRGTTVTWTVPII